MNELDDSSEIILIFPGIAERTSGKNDQRGTQALAATVNDIFAYLPDEADIRIKLLADNRIYRDHVAGDQTPDTFN